MSKKKLHRERWSFSAVLLAAVVFLAVSCAGQSGWAASEDKEQEPRSMMGQTAGGPSGGPPNGNPSGGTPPLGMPPQRGGQPGEMIAFAELTDTDSSAYFTDLDSSTSGINAYVDYLYEKGLIADDDSDGLYRPGDALSRGDFALMLYRRYNYSGEGFNYNDVGTDAYFYDAVMLGKASRVFENTEYFYPDKPVTREQAAIWIYKSELLHGMPKEMTQSDVSVFGDGSEISEEAKEAVSTLTRLGVFQADNRKNFEPAESFTRGEIAPLFYRVACLGGASGGIGGPVGPGGPGQPGSREVDHGDYTGKVKTDISGEAYESSGNEENALRIEGDVNITLSNIIVNKTNGLPGKGDTSNFYGNNAAVLVLGGAEAEFNDIKVSSFTNGGNGIFAYGEGTRVTVNNAIIRTNMGNAGGVMVTGGGAMTVKDSDIETWGRSSAALRTDKGGGVLEVSGGQYIAHGEGSPAVYSTADVTVDHATLTAESSEAVVVEGKNSVTLTDCTVTGNMIKENAGNLQNVMIYQSMSGDADTGRSSFTMRGGSLTSQRGDMFYITNTSCRVVLENVVLERSNEYLLKVVGNDARNGWGVVGKNGGQCDFTAAGQELSGKIRVDNISTLKMALSDGSVFTGSINPEGEGGFVSVDIDDASRWILTDDTYIFELTGPLGNIDTRDFHLYMKGQIVK